MTEKLESGQNKYGGERAKCPVCKKYNDPSYEFLVEDWRDFECSECHESSAFARYFPNELQKLKEELNK